MEIAPARSLSVSKRIHRLFPAAVWEPGSFLCARLLYACACMLLAYQIGPQKLGILLFVQWLAVFSVPALGADISQSASRRIAYLQSREAPRLIAGTFYFLWHNQHRNIARYCLLYLPITYGLSHLLTGISFNILLLAGLTTLPIQLSNVVSTTLRSLRRTDLLALLDIFAALLYLLFLILFTQIMGTSTEIVLLIGALTSTLALIMGVMSIIQLLPLGNARAPGIFLRERLQQQLRHPWLHFLLDAIVWQRCELLLLACLCRAQETGLYALAALVSSSCIGLMPYVLTRWIYPLFFTFFPRPRYDTKSLSFFCISRDLLFLTTACSLFIMLLAPEIIPLFLGKAYQPVTPLLTIFLIAATLGSVATTGIAHLKQHSKVLNWFQIGIAISKIIAIPICFYCWNIAGVALVSASAQGIFASVIITLCIYCFKRQQTGSDRGGTRL